MQESQSRTIPEEIVLRAEQMNAGIEDKMSNAKRNQSIQAIKTSNVYKNTCKQSNSYWPYKPVVLLLMAAVPGTSNVQCPDHPLLRWPPTDQSQRQHAPSGDMMEGVPP
jgi:hypothetical protein